MSRSLVSVAVLSFVCPAVLACGAEAPLSTAGGMDEVAGGDDGPADDALEDGSVERDAPTPKTDLSPELEQALELEALAPGYLPAEYPEAPYGFATNSVIPNFEFRGWVQPKASGYDAALLESVELARFYDPDGEKGLELLVINASAVWCSVCQTEYRDIAEQQIYTQLKERGVEMLGVLFEDRDALPARYSDLETWAQAFQVEFPFVLDPGFKMGSFFDRSATPMNMIIDARTMKVLGVWTGYTLEMYDVINTELVARGR